MKQTPTNKPLKQPIFIVGVGRSGTTLLQSMLHAHRQLAFTPETHFVRRYLARRKMAALLRKKDGDMFLKLIHRDNDLNRLEFDLEDILTELRRNGDLSLDSFYRGILERTREQKGATLVGDKDPKNIEYLPLIHHHFPDAFVIHIVRDPRAVTLSRMRAEWSSHRSFLSHVIIYNLQIHKGRDDGRALFGNHYYEIIYEDLVTNPEAECRRLCQWLDIPYDPGMLDFSKTSHEIIKGREIKWKEDCFKPVQTANKDKWSGGLTRRQICAIETMTAQWFDHFGYRKSGYLKDRTRLAALVHIILRLGMWKLNMAYRLFHWARHTFNRMTEQ